MSYRPRLTPAIADVRRAVRASLADLGTGGPASAAPPFPFSENEGDSREKRPYGVESSEKPRNSFVLGTGKGKGGGERSGEGAEKYVRPLVLVALSGGPDSLALAAATAFEAKRAGLRAGAVIVDHGLQPGSADAAAGAAALATELGLDPILVSRVSVGVDGGPEAAARTARYSALADAASGTGAKAVLLGHTLDDQAETVLLGLVRGSGGTSLHGMSAATPLGPVGEGVTAAEYRRPLLGIRRATTVQFCVDSGLRPWHDPQNDDAAFTRVRVRRHLIPALERELGPGVAEALARTAQQLREDSDALGHLAQEIIEDLVDHAEAGLSISIRGLAANPAALRQRIIRLAVASEFGVSLSRVQTLEVARLVTDWHGQGPVHLPGIRVGRRGGLLVFSSAPIDLTRKNAPRT